MAKFRLITACTQQKRKKITFFYRFFCTVNFFALYLHSQNGTTALLRFKTIAEIAQLVEHNLAKVGVASSSLVFRSKKESLRVF